MRKDRSFRLRRDRSWGKEGEVELGSEIRGEQSGVVESVADGEEEEEVGQQDRDSKFDYLYFSLDPYPYPYVPSLLYSDYYSLNYSLRSPIHLHSSPS